MLLRMIAMALPLLATHSGVARAETPTGALVVAQAQTARPPAKSAPAGKNCRREPIWGFRMSAFCKPTGICSDRVIKGYRTVCS